MARDGNSGEGWGTPFGADIRPADFPGLGRSCSYYPVLPGILETSLLEKESFGTSFHWYH